MKILAHCDRAALKSLASFGSLSYERLYSRTRLCNMPDKPKSRDPIQKYQRDAGAQRRVTDWILTRPELASHGLWFATVACQSPTWRLCVNLN